MPRHHPNCPFRPSSWPFFYGWFILVASAIGTVCSVPGQTMGVSAFTEPLISALGIDRTLISGAYMIGTAGSAFLLTWGGRLYDRYGARRTGIGSALLLGLVLLMLARSDSLSLGLAGLFGREGGVAFPFAVLTVGFLLLRFSGQGMLTMVSRNMLMKWFDHRRGLANSFMAVIVPVSFSISPLMLHRMIGALGWRGAWMAMGAACIGALTVFIALFYRDNPEDCSLRPDGGMKPKPHDPRHDPVQDWTLAQARRTRVFWVYNLTIALYALYLTALTFHVVSVFEAAGIGEERAFQTFIPASILTVVAGFITGWISDHIKLGYLLAVLMLGMAVSMTGVFLLGSGAGYGMVIIGNGTAGGTFGLLMSVTWPRYFGRKHLGAVSGFHMSWTVGFSAVGPYLFGLSYQYFQSYRAAVAACLAFLTVLAFLAARMKLPPKAPPAEATP